MAKPVRYYVKDILEELCGLVEDVCEPQRDRAGDPLDTVYTNGRPSQTDNHSEFIVVSLSRSVYSHGTHQNAAVYMDIYVKNAQGGIEKTWRLQEICDELTERFPYYRSKYPEDSKEKRWSMRSPKLVLSGDDQLGFTAWRLRWSLSVNTTDRFAIIDLEEDNNINN